MLDSHPIGHQQGRYPWNSDSCDPHTEVTKQHMQPVLDWILLLDASVTKRFHLCKNAFANKSSHVERISKPVLVTLTKRKYSNYFPISTIKDFSQAVESILDSGNDYRGEEFYPYRRIYGLVIKKVLNIPSF